jgi:hypothetical protein
MYTPAEVASLGGDVLAYGVHTGIPVTAKWNASNREKIREAKRIAAEKGIRIRFFVGARPDVYTEHEGFGSVPGFRDAWIMHISRSQYLKDRARFTSAGWTVDFVSSMSPRFMSRVLADPKRAPAFYGFRDPKEKSFRITNLLADVRNPEYRVWHIAWVRELLAYTGAEGVKVAVKTGWHANPQVVECAGPETRYNGPLSPTPYGPGEFEEAMGAYLVELASYGIPIVVAERPPGKGGLGAWYPPRVRAAVLGEMSILPLPHEEWFEGPPKPPRAPHPLPPFGPPSDPGLIPQGG